ncbi:hypothetical protein D3C75_1349680 [compost metagenome]
MFHPPTLWVPSDETVRLQADPGLFALLSDHGRGHRAEPGNSSDSHCRRVGREESHEEDVRLPRSAENSVVLL